MCIAAGRSAIDHPAPIDERASHLSNSLPYSRQANFSGLNVQRHHVPSGGARYWAALSIASIFGCNTGDAFASLFGFISGLPLLAVALAAIVYFERRDPKACQAYYWLAIVMVRTAATNLADFTAFWIGIAPAISLLTALLLAMLVHARVAWRPPATTAPGRIGLPPIDAKYWCIMLVAGTLGTAIGDFVSFRLGLGLPVASVVLSGIVAFALSVGRAGWLAVAVYYWFTIVAIRATGTAVGDLSAKLIGLAPSTMLSGLLLVMLLSLWRDQLAKRKPSLAALP